MSADRGRPREQRDLRLEFDRRDAIDFRRLTQALLALAAYERRERAGNEEGGES